MAAKNKDGFEPGQILSFEELSELKARNRKKKKPKAPARVTAKSKEPELENDEGLEPNSEGQ